MKKLWAPWRLEYVLSEKDGGCVFCHMDDKSRDAERKVLYRGEFNFIVLNIYPYNNGHMMVVPYRHMADIEKLSPEEAAENMHLVQMAVKVLKKQFAPTGFNVGLNIGKDAGAGIDSHLHMHIVPRWAGDSNFMPVLSEVRVLPQHIEDTYSALVDAFKDI